MGMTQMMDIEEIRATEAEQALPHDFTCFEYAAEEITEELADQGIEIDGNGSDITVNGITLMDQFHQEQLNGKRACRCIKEWDGPTDFEEEV